MFHWVWNQLVTFKPWKVAWNWTAFFSIFFFFLNRRPGKRGSIENNSKRFIVKITKTYHLSQWISKQTNILRWIVKIVNAYLRHSHCCCLEINCTFKGYKLKYALVHRRTGENFLESRDKIARKSLLHKNMLWSTINILTLAFTYFIVCFLVYN